MTRILAIDPSGNFKEGKGTTGFALFKKETPIALWAINSDRFDSDIEYWAYLAHKIEYYFPDVVVMEGYRLYNHKGIKASTQSNSDLETPQLIGALKLKCYELKIPYVIQYASEVKQRWNNNVLVNKGYLKEKNNRLYFEDMQTNDHVRDALRHGLHYLKYGRK